MPKIISPSTSLASPRRAPKTKVSGVSAPAGAFIPDATDLLLLEELQDNARISFTELARCVHLSTPSVIERVRRLEKEGVILRYRAHLDHTKLGLHVGAFVKVTVSGDRLSNFARVARSVPEVLECHRVTGNESFLVQVAVRDMNHLELVIDALMPYVATNTSMILNSPVQGGRISLSPATGRESPQ
ncbi:MAG: Lrp/AsnC family transcriptional regulator [Janthinobacterium lividum]